MSVGGYALEKRYSHADYASWDDNTRWELLDGIPYAMSAPSSAHQEISVGLTRLLANYLAGKPCKVYHSPYDVRLNYDSGDDTVVQPDLAIVCDPSKRDAIGCLGAPDLIDEILSSSTARMDRVLKHNKYYEVRGSRILGCRPGYSDSISILA